MHESTLRLPALTSALSLPANKTGHQHVKNEDDKDADGKEADDQHTTAAKGHSTVVDFSKPGMTMAMASPGSTSSRNSSSSKDSGHATVTSSSNVDVNKPPGLSYIALISMAIQSSADQKMMLADIYQWISEKYPYYQLKDKSWRNSIRHNLSLNECFIKSGRSENGKGSYWCIHPANVEDFAMGDYRRRRARRRVRKCDEDLQRLCFDLPSPTGQYPSSSSSRHLPSETRAQKSYVPMASSLVPSNFLSTIGVEPTTPYDYWSQTRQHYPTGVTNMYQQAVTDCKDSKQTANYTHALNSAHAHLQYAQYFGHVNCSDSTSAMMSNDSTVNVNMNVYVCGTDDTQRESTSYSSSYQPI